MKCDKLKVYGMADPAIGDEYEMYKVTEVDEAIAELKQKLHDVDNQWNEQCKEIAELKAKLESVQATAYADSVDAGMRERKLRRALWLARAKRATEKADSFIDIKVTYHGVCNINHSVYPENNARRMLNCDEWLDVWTNVWDKCLKKAEECK